MHLQIIYNMSKEDLALNNLQCHKTQLNQTNLFTDVYQSLNNSHTRVMSPFIKSIITYQWFTSDDSPSSLLSAVDLMVKRSCLQFFFIMLTDKFELSIIAIITQNNKAFGNSWQDSFIRSLMHMSSFLVSFLLAPMTFCQTKPSLANIIIVYQHRGRLTRLLQDYLLHKGGLWYFQNPKSDHISRFYQEITLEDKK